MVDINKLRKQRSYIKGKLTRIEQSLARDQAAATLDKEDAEVRLERLDQVIREFQAIQTQIFNEIEEPSVADATVEAEFEERSSSMRVFLKRIINGGNNEVSPSESNNMLMQLIERQMKIMERYETRSPLQAQAGSDALQDSQDGGLLGNLMQTQTEILQRLSEGNTEGVNGRNRVKLPIIKLPTFDGKIEEWTKFADAFTKTIHDNINLPNIQKFIYLRSCVAGAAARAIEDIELSDDNYPVAWEQLRKRFEDTGVIKRKHVQCLFEMPLVSKESASAIMHLVDHVNKHTRILKRLGSPTESWDDLLIYMVESKLDQATLRVWEERNNIKATAINEDASAHESNFNELMEFLIQRCHALERIESSKARVNVNKDTSKSQGTLRSYGKTNQSKINNNDKVTSLASFVVSNTCFLCNESHLLYNCAKFLAMAPEERSQEVRRLKLCINCLRNDHFAKSCKHGSCRECSGKHNTLLHLPITSHQSTVSTTKDSSTNGDAKASYHSSGLSKCNILMATTVVNAVNQKGVSSPIRVLLDSGSEANFITQSTCNKLGLKRNATSEIISGVNDSEYQIRQVTEIIIKSKHSLFQFNAQCLVVPKITRNLPSQEIDKRELNIPLNLQLADFEFNKSNSIDALIGAEFFFELLENGKINLGENKPFLQNTKLGWVVAGSIAEDKHSGTSTRVTNVLHCCLTKNESLDKTLRQFWELESFPENSNNTWSIEEKECEKRYIDTTTRDEQGRFIVSLPFKTGIANIGETRNAALKRLYQIERRFTNDYLYHERYVQFMREYLDLEHMSLVESCNVETNKPIIYLPHHGVTKETSSTTKLRVVFDASNKSNTGTSLNDILMVGPTLQDNLIHILLRFRFYNVAIIGDLEKMYRQIAIRAADRDYQRILWRFSRNDPVQEYRLNTVTYGQASASYLAIRSVRQLANEGKEEFPLASKCILNDMYVDDIISGARNLDEAKLLQEQLIELMSQGCFKVHKWHSSAREILHNINDQEKSSSVDIKLNDVTRTLGLIWEPNTDVFITTISFKPEIRTKRELLSEISKLFDPLGLLGPVTTLAKILMQETWKEKIDWDQDLPTNILNYWNKLKEELSNPTTFRIPRKVFKENTSSNNFILYGFCDASQSAYGACIYVKVQGREEPAQLLCSKSRIAPIKIVSIPRLELCSALLLSRLVAQVKQACKFEFYKIFAFTDSLVTLYWIKGDLSRWKTFVANRVSEITDIISADMWAHVKGEENPADLLSRGAFPSILQNCHAWWAGPRWISDPSTEIQSQANLADEQLSESREILAEEKCSRMSYHNAIQESTFYEDLYARVSDLSKIERVLAYCLRFIFNCRNIKGRNKQLSISEIDTARSHLIKDAQAKTFRDEIAILQQGKFIRTSSRLAALHPFLDEKDLLRVGGRLRHASLSFDHRHPILLPHNHVLTRLIIEREHKRLLHSGPQALLAAVRQKYWPLRGRDIVRKVCHSCIWCMRKCPRSSVQLMGDLPTDRVTPMRPFFNCGVDFAGPIITLINKGRGRKTNKSYIALFICFATKAIHLEAVSDLSTEAFLAALRRFIGRRGRPQKIYSDNATNFKGAQREINEIYAFVRQEVQGSLQNELAAEGIQWDFIPPYSPHVGGLWEAGVKSCKNLLRTVMGNHLLTFEELYTALVQVESCLNSRPLYALSNDPSDLEPLTPGHFLTGGPITALPEINLQDLNIHRLNRWQLVQRIFQNFWKRWAAEYLTSIQGRSKWKQTRPDLEINDLVVLREEHIPPY